MAFELKFENEITKYTTPAMSTVSECEVTFGKDVMGGIFKRCSYERVEMCPPQ